MENYTDGIVYVVDNDDFILSEFPCDFSYAIQMYMGQRDHRGNRYIIKQYGQSILPYKRKIKKTFTVRQPEP